MIIDVFDITMDLNDPILSRIVLHIEGLNRAEAIKFAQSAAKLLNEKSKIAYILKGYKEK